MPIDDREIKRAALVGLYHERQRMDELIARLERELGTGTVNPGTEMAKAAPRRRQMSAAGRANIITAVKKRWAAVRKAKTAAAKIDGPKPGGKNTVSKPVGKKRTSKPNAPKTKRRGARKHTSPKPAAVPVPAAEVVQGPEVPVS